MISTFTYFIAFITLPGAIYLLVITIAGYRAIPIPNKEISGETLNGKRIDGLNIAIIIPAHDEEINIAQTLIHINKCLPNKGSYDVWTIIDNCTDNTQAVAKEHGSSILVRNNSEQKGKSYALNFAFDTLSTENYDVFIVLDADTLCQKNLLLDIERAFSRGADAAQMVNLIQTEQGNRYSMLTGLGFVAMNLVRPRARKLLGLSVGLFGTGFAIDSEVLRKCPYDTHSIVEDAQYHIKLLLNGYKSVLVESSTVYSQVPAYTEGAEQQRNRWEGGRIRLLRDNIGPLVSAVLNGNWRLLDPLFEMLLMPLSYHLLGLIIITALAPNTMILIYSLINLSIVAAHFLCVTKHSNKPPPIFAILLALPGYLIWKIKILISTLNKSKRDTSWIRTQRK
jgi:cellulose synthase/poly-beta-1,6-N-acetylglucosamine synthase-like glycosyltransferase